MKNGPATAARTGKAGVKVFALAVAAAWMAAVATGQAPPNAPAAVDAIAKTVTLPGGAEMAMVYCVPGEFSMGSPEGSPWRWDDETLHRVTLTKGFWMARTEVTQRQWVSVMGRNPSEHKGDDLPVENVSWNDCQAFCKKAGMRLPTEAEWEYACRAGSTGTYAGTGDLEDMGWFYRNSGKETHPVGQKLPNAWGFFDMHGNVAEWCEDWHGKYPAGAATDPAGPASGEQRVLRGGSWHYGAGGCRSSHRASDYPEFRGHEHGFRPCLREGGQ